MTNTKFRKRALLSSVAMLLVALVALGSATFAWFTDNPVANAAGISGKGQTSTGLIIHTDTDPTPSDTHNAEFFKGVSTDYIMVPAFDTNFSHTFVKAPAANSHQSTADTTKTWGTVTVRAATGGEGVYKESAYLNTTGQGSTATAVYLTGLEINQTSLSNPMKDAACVAVYVGNTHIATYKVGGTAPIDYGTVANGDDVTIPSPLAYQTVKSFGASSGVATSLGTCNDGGTVTGASTLQVDFYVYLDGSDASVTTDNAEATAILSGITAHFSTNAPA